MYVIGMKLGARILPLKSYESVEVFFAVVVHSHVAVRMLIEMLPNECQLLVCRLLISRDVAGPMDVYVFHVLDAVRTQRTQELIFVIKVRSSGIYDYPVLWILFASSGSRVYGSNHLSDWVRPTEHFRALEFMVVVVMIGRQLVVVVLRGRKLLNRISRCVFHVYLRVRVNESIVYVKHVK